MVPSIVKPPELKLKSLPKHLKYGYLGDKNMLPMIVATSLDTYQEGALLNILKWHKKAIGWTIADIKGINPALCQRKIRLEEGKKLVVDA